MKNSTMILHAPWIALFNLLTLVNKSGNKNIAGLTSAMDFEASLDVKMTRLDQPLGFLLMANFSKEVTIIHHPQNFGGTLLCPKHRGGGTKRKRNDNDGDRIIKNTAPIT